MTLKIYHNPRCSKSRQTLALIEASSVQVDIIRYLETPPDGLELKGLQNRLGFGSARDMMRKGEALYKELGLKDEIDETLLIKAMAENPKLIERPIVDNGQRAIMGRPPENVKSLL